MGLGVGGKLKYEFFFFMFSIFLRCGNGGSQIDGGESVTRMDSKRACQKRPEIGVSYGMSHE